MTPESTRKTDGTKNRRGMRIFSILIVVELIAAIAVSVALGPTHDPAVLPSAIRGVSAKAFDAQDAPGLVAVTPWKEGFVAVASPGIMSSLMGIFGAGSIGGKPSSWHSEDGTSWNALGEDLGDQGATLSDITSSSRLLVAVGSKIDYSLDMMMSEEPSDALPFAAVIRTSRDGRVWQDALTLPGDGTETMLTTVTHSSSGFVAMGVTGGGAGNIDAVAWHSRDGLTWKRAQAKGFASANGEWVTDVAPHSAGFTAVGFELPKGAFDAQDSEQMDFGDFSDEPQPPNPMEGIVPAIWTSLDGRTWDRIKEKSLSTEESVMLQGISTNGENTVAVGTVLTPKNDLEYDPYASISDPIGLGMSGDLADARPAAWTQKADGPWTRVTEAGYTGSKSETSMRAVSALGDGFVAVGGGLDMLGINMGMATVWTSRDGSKWSEIDRPACTDDTSVMADIAVNADGALAIVGSEPIDDSELAGFAAEMFGGESDMLSAGSAAIWTGAQSANGPTWIPAPSESKGGTANDSVDEKDSENASRGGELELPDDFPRTVPVPDGADVTSIKSWPESYSGDGQVVEFDIAGPNFAEVRKIFAEEMSRRALARASEAESTKGCDSDHGTWEAPLAGCDVTGQVTLTGKGDEGQNLRVAYEQASTDLELDDYFYPEADCRIPKEISDEVFIPNFFTPTEVTVDWNQDSRPASVVGTAGASVSDLAADYLAWLDVEGGWEITTDPVFESDGSGWNFSAAGNGLSIDITLIDVTDDSAPSDLFGDEFSGEFGEGSEGGGGLFSGSEDQGFPAIITTEVRINVEHTAENT